MLHVYKDKRYKLIQHKYLELQLRSTLNSNFNLHLKRYSQGEQPGIAIEINIGKFYYRLLVYDERVNKKGSYLVPYN